MYRFICNLLSCVRNATLSIFRIFIEDITRTAKILRAYLANNGQ